MKYKSILLVSSVLASLFVLGGCSSSSEPEVDKNVPMGSSNDPFKPTSVTGAGGGNTPKGGQLGTPAAQ